MGTSVGIIHFTSSDWITLAGVLITSITAYYIVTFVQRSVTDKRTLKDLLIADVRKIEADYRDWLGHIHDGNMRTSRVLSGFKLLNMRIDNLMISIPSEFSIDKKKLLPYQQLLPVMITDSQEFIDQHGVDKPFQLSERLKSELITFQVVSGRLFMELIIQINKC